MNIERLALRVAELLEAHGLAYFLTGSFSSNYYGIPRSTEDADFVINCRTDQLDLVWRAFEGEFEVDAQISFETQTGSRRIDLRHPGSVFKIELFLLSHDAHDQERFRRRRAVRAFGRTVWLPTPEDVVIQKLRWARGKDLDDVRDVLAVQGSALDFSYLARWCEQHGTLPLLREIQASLPPV